MGERVLNKEYKKLIEKVKKIDSNAARYLEKKAPKLENFVQSGSLSSAFGWWRTPQGHKYWRKINIKLNEGGKQMPKKEYKKGKTVYLQFNCPTNEDDLTMKGSFKKEDMDEDYPYTKVKLTGELFEIQSVKKERKVR